MKRLLGLVCVFLYGVCVSSAWGQDVHPVKLVFSCRADNDLYRLLSPQDGILLRYATPADAISNAPDGYGVLLLADGYPAEPTQIAEHLIDLAHKKRLRVFIEFPENIPAMYIAPAREMGALRTVVSSDWFGAALPKGRILSINAARFFPIDAHDHHLLLAQTAGYDQAAHGVPEWQSPYEHNPKTFALLAKHPLTDILVSSTKISDFITARNAPAEAWTAVWSSIVSWLANRPIDMPAWAPAVRPSYARDGALPEAAEREAFTRATQWLLASKLLQANGTQGIQEGHASTIDYAGNQPVKAALRAGTASECAMALAFNAKLADDAKSREAADNLLAFIFDTSGLVNGNAVDADSPISGLIGRDTEGGSTVYCGDDNARTVLGALATSALLKTDKWDAAIERCLMANLRTSCVNGFRQECITADDLAAHGWQAYSESAYALYTPQSQAYLWACFLWAYQRTQHAPFLERARAGITMTMAAYPNDWRWTYSMQAERARMLLPLAWLVRIEDTPVHRGWLRRVADDLLAHQDESGAIQEQLGPTTGPHAYGVNPPPNTNAQYGTRHAPVIQTNNDPAADLRYTMNFAFIGLHEAAAATGDAFYSDAENKLADFLCRVQIQSRTHPELDGAWCRAFDYAKWEYWGSNADPGWGAWSISAGQTQSWVASTLALRQMKTSLGDMLFR